MTFFRRKFSQKNVKSDSVPVPYPNKYAVKRQVVQLSPDSGYDIENSIEWENFVNRERKSQKKERTSERRRSSGCRSVQFNFDSPETPTTIERKKIMTKKWVTGVQTFPGEHICCDINMESECRDHKRTSTHKSIY